MLAASPHCEAVWGLFFFGENTAKGFFPPAAHLHGDCFTSPHRLRSWEAPLGSGPTPCGHPEAARPPLPAPGGPRPAGDVVGWRGRGGAGHRYNFPASLHGGGEGSDPFESLAPLVLPRDGGGTADAAGGQSGVPQPGPDRPLLPTGRQRRPPQQL